MISRALPVSPVANRLGLLDGHPRHAAVLKVAAEQAGWGTSLPKGRGLGVAVHESFHSFVAQMEGGIGYTLGAALRDKVTLTNGVVDQSNFTTTSRCVSVICRRSTSISLPRMRRRAAWASLASRGRAGYLQCGLRRHNRSPARLSCQLQHRLLDDFREWGCQGLVPRAAFEGQRSQGSALTGLAPAESLGQCQITRGLGFPRVRQDIA
jgi:hypothetical protein